MHKRIVKAWAHWGREFTILIAAEHGFPVLLVVLGHFMGYWAVLR